MSSKPRGKRSKKEQTASDANANAPPEARDSTRQRQRQPQSQPQSQPKLQRQPQPQPPRLLTHEDPLLPTSVLERSKIKNFLYKVEPNMPKLSAPALDLISTTAALLLKSVVERAALVERRDRVGTDGTATATARMPPAAAGLSSKRRAAGNGNGNGNSNDNSNSNSSSNANAEPDVLLITTNHLKRAVASASVSVSASAASNASCLGCLEEPYETLRDKDASVLPYRRQAYVPRTPAAKRAKQKRTHGRRTMAPAPRAVDGTLSEVPPKGVSSAVAKAVSTTPHTTDVHADAHADAGADADAGPLEKAIADAAAANETCAVPNEIVEDDDDYD